MLFIISQRIDHNQEYPELRDALDVRYNLYFESLGIYVLPVSNNPHTAKVILNEVNPSGVILSGGNDLNEFFVREQTENELINYCIKNNKPIIGICRGAQKLNQYFGGDVEKLHGHVGTCHNVWQDGNCLPKAVNSFHNYGIFEHTLSIEMLPLFTCQDGSIEAFRHRKYPFLGIMWHPERMDDPCVLFKELLGNVL